MPSSKPATYNDKLELAYPSARNSTDPVNRAAREAFFTVKDFGYDDYEKNALIINTMKDQGKLDNIMAIAELLERAYAANGRQSMSNIPARAPASQPAPVMQPTVRVK